MRIPVPRIMMNAAAEHGRFHLEITAGPLRGTRFALGDTIMIGRSSQAEILVADADVSRQHAKVIPLPDGGHLLIDLGSAHGTHVSGRSICEHRLVPGESFTIGSTVFVYDVRPSLTVARGVYTLTSAHGEAVDRTVISVPNEPERPVDMEVEECESTAPIDAWASDGATYLGDLLQDVILYRNLRLRLSRGDAMPPPLRASFDALERRLRAPRVERHEPGPMREFARFVVDLPAHLRVSQRDEVGMPVWIRDFGVGGSRIACPPSKLAIDDLTWLAIDVPGPDGARTIVFTARVVWMRGDEMGLVFSGAPGWARRSGASELEDTLQPVRVSPAQRRTRQIRLRLASSDDEP